jgi:NAD-dependent DNA ligase
MSVFTSRLHPPAPVPKRDVDQLIATCKGLMADGHVNELEYSYLLRWFQANEKQLGRYPYNVIYDRLSTALADGVVDEDEERDLLALITGLVSERERQETAAIVPGVVADPKSPFTDPEPEILFKGSNFVVTGIFDYGDRESVMGQISRRGGSILRGITRDTKFVVVGAQISPDWAYGNFGTKIDKACDYIRKGHAISIVSEACWARAVASQPANW